jgi:hypothetical protein
MKLHHRGEKHSTRKALATIGVCVAAIAGLIYWHWPFFEFWILMFIINF